MEELEREVARKSISGRWYGMIRTENVADRNRSRFEIIAEILRNMREPTCWTNVMAHCNMSSRQSGQYFGLLKSSDLIQKDTATGKAKYQRTEAGRKFLKTYGKMALLLDPSIPLPSLI
jgi:predicted transcriptional regulator